MIRELPIIEHKGDKYFRDDKLRQIRNVKNPDEYVYFNEIQDGGE